MTITDTAWHRLDPRTILVRCAWLAPPLASIAAAALATGGRSDLRLWIPLAAIGATFAAITLIGLLRWRTTRYRLAADSIELHLGLLGNRRRTLPLTRVRYVGVTANPLHRILGLAVVRIGTAGTVDDRGELSLDALSRATAERLCEALRTTSPEAEQSTVLSAMNLRWIRYAPLTFWVLGGVAVVAGTVYRVFHGIGIEIWQVGFVRDAFTEFGNSALWLTIPLLLLGIAALGSIGATGIYLENWWRFRLEWADPATLSVQRGLLTTRSVAMERNRLRGAVLREPLLLRLGGGASVTAVAGGLGNREEARRRSGLLPPAPRAEAVQVVAEVTGMAADLVSQPRTSPHPSAALRRRLWRGLGFVVLPATVVLLALGLLLSTMFIHCAWIFVVLSIPATWWLARDAYRALGHGFRGDHLLFRSGTFSRDTVVLRRDGIAGWTFTSTPFSRRAGLVTVTAAVAAGEHGYRCPDMPAGEAAEFADLAAPGILDEFLDRG